ncbi:MAG: DUF4198 domain-containing protein [Pseudomonadota bacterium]
MHFKNYPLLKLAMASMIASLTTVYANSHELWIDPERFLITIDEEVRAELRVGEKYAGGTSPYLPTRTERLEAYIAGRASNIGGRAGDRPAIQFNAEQEGLLVIAYESDVSTVRYTDFEKFRAFVDHKNFDGALQAHSSRNLSTDDFVETYSRHAKSLIAIGDGAGSDIEVGMITEIIALDNPYKTDVSQGIRIKVNYLGSPRADAQVEIYMRPSGEGNGSENVTVDTVFTDAAGIVTIPIKTGHDYMLDAVVLREPPPERAEIRDAVWDSLWANLTFSVPAGR